MLQLIHQQVNAGTWFMAFIILGIAKHSAESCSMKFSLILVTYLLKRIINAGVVFLITKIIVAIYFAYLVFQPQLVFNG